MVEKSRFHDIFGPTDLENSNCNKNQQFTQLQQLTAYASQQRCATLAPTIQ